MLKLSWMDMATNVEVLETTSERKSLAWSSVEKRGNEWIGHISRHGGLLGLIIEDCEHV